ncbi:MAG: anthranilate synthase component I family protein [Rickettsiales bacterium]|nr:anthranilate synthase component I family protein [Rickettsiales bacterium]
MYTPQSLPWTEPLALAQQIDEPRWVLLYSSAQTSYSGQFSYLACGHAETVEAADFTAFAARLTTQRPRFDHAWFGYLGYELKHCLEQLPKDAPEQFGLPPLCMMRFHHIYVFDHRAQTLTLWSDGTPAHPRKTAAISTVPAVQALHSNMTSAEYLLAARAIIERIQDGELYQANLTRKFFGEFVDTPDPLTIFRQLCDVSPAPYSAYIYIDGRAIISSSPEMFLQLDASGELVSRPIKGTAARFDDPKHDQASYAALCNSTKDRAENLMIVDLMRNDFSKGCKASSIRVERLFEVTSHAKIHHMSSEVHGIKRPEVSALDMVQYCFPPGSMTGAPKIHAMRVCSEYEKQARGVYSGAIGWFGGDGSCELSVVIRTLIVEGKRFEFQVGGGIVADSAPEKELQEIIDKSAGLLKTLHMDAAQIRSL